MGFGWNMAPALFETVMSAVTKYLRELYPEIGFFVFYDDILLTAKS